MPQRGPGFSTQEVEVLLESVARYLPIGGTEWDAVLSEHETRFPTAGRTKDGLKRKFTGLYGTRIPTGDPHIPCDVRRAKELYEEGAGT